MAPTPKTTTQPVPALKPAGQPPIPDNDVALGPPRPPNPARKHAHPKVTLGPSSRPAPRTRANQDHSVKVEIISGYSRIRVQTRRDCVFLIRFAAFVGASSRAV